jgi:hypothetical protein
MRVGHFLVGVAVVVACTKAALQLGSREQLTVAVDGNGAFGEVEIDKSSPPRSFTVRVAGATTLEVDEIEAIESTCPDFLVMAPGLPLGDPTKDRGPIVSRLCSKGEYGQFGFACTEFEEVTYKFDVVYHPTSLGASSPICKVVVRLKGGSSTSIPVSGTGVLPDFVAIVSPSAVDFREVTVDRAALAPIVVSSGGRKNLGIISAGVAGAGFSLVAGNPGSHSIATSETYQVQCLPPSENTFTGTFTLATNDTKRPQIVVPLTCKGIVSSIANISIPPSIETTVGKPAVTIPLPVLNVTALDVTITAATIASPRAAELSITTSIGAGIPLAAGASTTLDIAWNPAEPFDGDLGSVTLTVAEDAAPHEFAIATSAQALLALVTSDHMTADMAVVDFKQVCVGPPATATVQMRAGSTPGVHTSFTIESLDLPATQTVFEVDPPANPVVDIGAGADLVITTHALLGVREATLVVHTDSPTQPTYPIALRVEGLLPGATVSPSELTFQRTIAGGFASSKVGRFLNCFDGPIQILGIALDGTSAADFSITRISPENEPDQLIQPGYMLASGDEIEIEVQMLPQTDGVKAARIVIDYQQPNSSTADAEQISLTGEAFERLQRDSYYRCSTGSIAQSWPLVAVVWLVVRRRKRRYASGSDGRSTQDRDRSHPRR